MFKQFLFSLFLFLVFASGLQAQTHAWNTALDGNWNDPLNWNTGTVPNGAADFPSIAATGAPYAVTMNIDVLMDGFNFVADSATLNLTGRTITNMAGGVVRGDGTLNLVGGATLQNDGALRPGNEGVGTLDITGGFTQSSGGFIVAELGGLTPDTEHDVLDISGTANLDGEVRVRSVNGFVPVSGNQFVILTAGNINGTFRKARLVGSDLPLGLKFDLVYTATTVTAQVVNEFGNIAPEATPISVSDPVPGIAGQNNTFQIDGLGGSNNTQLVFGLGLGTSVIAGCPVDFGIASATSVGTAGYFQALDVEECQLSDVVTFLFP